MPDTVIKNPILNSPYQEPDRHWLIGCSPKTNHQLDHRGPRPECLLLAVSWPKKKGKPIEFDMEWFQGRIEPSDRVNRIRERVKHWREGEYRGIPR
jgi:type III restriction enzyme